jgi:hypothetical protein
MLLLVLARRFSVCIDVPLLCEVFTGDHRGGVCVRVTCCDTWCSNCDLQTMPMLGT